MINDDIGLFFFDGTFLGFSSSWGFSGVLLGIFLGFFLVCFSGGFHRVFIFYF